MDEESERGGPPRQIGEMVSRALSKTRLSGDQAPQALPRHDLARLDNDTMSALAEIARAPLPALPPIERDVLVKSLAALDAALPRRRSDDDSGRLMLATYVRKLGHMPKAQIDYLCNVALDTLEWFPTIAKCKQIAEGWKRPDAIERARARNLLAHEMHLRMLDAHRRLKWGEDIAQAEVDGWPDDWREAAIRARLLTADGQIKPRPAAGLIAPPLPTTKETPHDDARTDPDA